MSEVQQKLSRRRLVAGAGTAGTVAVAATLLPSRKEAAPQAAAPDTAKTAEASGYRETDHVLRYYRTARI